MADSHSLQVQTKNEPQKLVSHNLSHYYVKSNTKIVTTLFAVDFLVQQIFDIGVKQ